MPAVLVVIKARVVWCSHARWKCPLVSAELHTFRPLARCRCVHVDRAGSDKRLSNVRVRMCMSTQGCVECVQ